MPPVAGGTHGTSQRTRPPSWAGDALSCQAPPRRCGGRPLQLHQHRSLALTPSLRPTPPRLHSRLTSTPLSLSPPPLLHHLPCFEVLHRRRLPQVGDVDYDGAMSGLALAVSTRPTSRLAWAGDLPVAGIMTGRSVSASAVPAVDAVASKGGSFSSGVAAGG
ncbi:hypothetical protein I4F81_003975 [Pyropia yezoensis]|uniref:Uncharacterized protein n=1 Tax=Pyropia yezoensis TaxID=2788 RepID=A0ACC3BTL3_PYRYE|nr:hypothetical protein I4F81_003975 [Neopyropia yezoensis]